MKAKAIIIASVLLVGCQATNNTGSQQQTHGLSANDGMTLLTDTTHERDTIPITQQDNLWQFISHDLTITVPDNRQVREQKAFYLSKKSYLHNVLLRADPYLYWIVEQIQARQMPMELALLPIVESAFNPYAKSPANAAGIWQIIPSTGRIYGLKQSKGYDGRYDIAAATTAALDILQRLNTMFNGDWLLTIAAYNSGEGRVLRAIKNNEAQGKPTDYWSLQLPKETTEYVPRLLALSDIFRHNQRYGLQLPATQKERALVKVPINAPVDISQISQITGIDKAKLKTFNAGVRGSIYGLNGPQYVMVPHKYASSLSDALENGQFIPVSESLIASNRSVINREAAGRSGKTATRHYKVRTRDTLSGIARQLNVSVKDLQAWNKLRGNLIKPGQTLLVRADTKHHTTAVQANKRQPANSKSATKLAKNRTNDTLTYKVRKGDSLYSIAKRHGVTINDLRRWNNQFTSNLKPGDLLTLYLKTTKTTPDS